MQYADQLAHVRRVAQQSGDTTWGAAQRAVLDRLDKLETQLALKQEMVCSYCGTVTLRSGRSEEDFTADLREHIINCDKRPDRQYLNLILSITEPLGIDPGSFAPGDLDSMTAAIDKRWKEVMALIPTYDVAAIAAAAVDFCAENWADFIELTGTQSMDAPVHFMELCEAVRAHLKTKTPETPAEKRIAEIENAPQEPEQHS